MNMNWLLDRVLSDFWPFGKDWDAPYRPFMPDRDDHFHGLMEKEVSDDGLVVTKRIDFDGDRDFDLISTSTTTPLANGDRQVVVEFRDGADTLLRKISTTTSDSGTSKMTTIDLDGDGQIDRQVSVVKADDGTLVRTLSEYSEDGSLKSQDRYTFSPSDKTVSHEWDRDGNGQYEGSSVQELKYGFEPSMFWSTLGFGWLGQGWPHSLKDGEDGPPWAGWNGGNGGPSGNAIHVIGDDAGSRGSDVDLLANVIGADQFEFSENARKHEEGNDTHYRKDLSGFTSAAEHGFSHPASDWGRISELPSDDAGHLPHQHEVAPISLAYDDFLFV